MISTRWLLVLVPSSLAFAAPRVADACSPPACRPATFVPAEGVHVPANVPGLVWTPLFDAFNQAPPDPAHVSLVRAADPSTPLPFKAQAIRYSTAFLLVPDAPLTAGETYLVTDGVTCTDDGKPGAGTGATTRFVAAAEAPLPTELGTITTGVQLSATRTVPVSTGECTKDMAVVQRTITLAMDAKAAPWADLLQLQVFVDNAQSSGDVTLVRSSVDGRAIGARVDVFRICPTLATDTTPDTRQLQLRATLEGMAAPVVSTTIPITLVCPATSQPPVTPPVTPPAQPPVDPPVTDHGDAGCNATGSGSLAWLGLALGALVVVRRTRR
ncbi:MAG: hypothetical protein ABIY55_10950 [Kofleriaceae bacterium]